MLYRLLAQRPNIGLMGVAWFLLLSSMVIATGASTVMGIDFGSQYIKVAYAAPRGSPPIMLNNLSERMTLNIVAFRDGRPLFGPDAVKVFLNQPENAYTWLSLMLGARFDSAAVQERLAYMAAKFEVDEDRKTLLFRTKDDELAPVEYLTAMIFVKLSEWTRDNAKRRATEAVITVPPHFSQAQRQGIIDSARIAGLSVLSLTSSTAAAALYYGAFSMGSATEGRHVIFFDAGACHTAASLVSIEPNHEENKKSAMLVEVKHTVWDTVLHGSAIDHVIANILIGKFGAQVPKGKAYNRLLSEAGRLKHILSVNPSFRVFLEELVDDKHLSAQITRDEVEEGCAHLRDRASRLITGLLEDSQILPERVHAIILVGGSSRVPFIQEDLRRSFGDKVQTVLNMDESIAQGAVLYAASLANLMFKPIRLRDAYTDVVKVHYGADLSVPVYQKFSALDGHKGVAFKNMDSIDATIRGESQGDLLAVKVGGMEEALAKFDQKTIVSSKLKFWVDLNTSGMIVIRDSPVALVEHEEEEKPTGDTSNLNSTSVSSTANNTKDGGSVPDDGPAQPLVPQKVVKTVSVPLKYSVKLLYPHLQDESISRWAREIEKGKREEEERVFRSAQRNDLEATLYELMEEIEGASYRTHAKPSEIDSLRSLFDSASEMLKRREEELGPEDYAELRRTLLTPAARIKQRTHEEGCRPASLESMRRSIEGARKFVEGVRRDHPEASQRAQTDEELGKLAEKTNSTADWLNDVEAEQSKLAPSDDPIASCAEIDKLARELYSLHLSLALKKLPEPKKTAPKPDDVPTAAPGEATATGAPPTNQTASDVPPEQSKIKGEEAERMEL